LTGSPRIPGNSSNEDWLGHIKDKGNEATHEIEATSPNDATILLEFTQYLLRHLFESPVKMRRLKPAPPTS
jgi:hypothetical protein